MTPDGWVVYSLLKGALVVGEALRAASEAHAFAEVVSAFSADVALEARDTDLEGNPIADAQPSHLGPDGHNLAG